MRRRRPNRHLTDEGAQQVEDATSTIENLNDPENTELNHHIHQRSAAPTP